MNLLIVGLGLIGGSLALDLKKNSFAKKIWGIDHSSLHASEALKLALVVVIIEAEVDIIKCDVDIIILAIPVTMISQKLITFLDLVLEKTTITDVGSTKGQLCQLVKNHPKRKQYVPSHPMAGTEHSGPHAAFSGLFTNKTAVICDEKDSSLEHLTKVIKMYESLQMRLSFMNSQKHDLHAAYVSHLSHISSFVLALTVLHKEKNVDAIFDLASAGFESTVRLAKSSPQMWAPIFEQNRSHVTDALGEYIKELQLFYEALKKKDFSQTINYMTEANEIRRVLEDMKKRYEGQK